MKVALIQMCSSLNFKDNIKKIDLFIREIKKEAPNVEAVFLPEVFYSMSNGKEVTPYLVEDENEHFMNIKSLAVEHKVYLLGGSVAFKEGSKILNRNLNFSPKGEVLGVYDKMNLFALNLKGKDKANLDESRVYSKGDKPLDIKIGDFHFGFSICFDLRFPELYRKYFSCGVNVLSISSAFTVPTGKAHWETLIRSRAIENQSYVIAANQWGEHNDSIKTYGHSMIVDPWGEIVSEIKEGEGHILADLSLKRVDSIRQRMKVDPT